MVPKGTRQQVVAVSLCRGNLWGHIKFLYLRQNMRLGHSEADNQHAQWLLESATLALTLQGVGLCHYS